jgi:hypothetical protein
MESKKINQLATELTPALSDLTIIGDPTTGISKKITLSQMASLFTGTVEEYANFAAFPLVGVADTIYIALDTNVLYRWNTGTSAYVELSPNIINSLVFSDANGFDGNISLVGSVATLTITTALTTGSVPFIGASGALSQDNANLFFDDTNNRLGINTNSPTTALDVFGSGIIGRINGTSTNNAFLGFASAGTNKWSIGNVQSDHRFRIYNEATTSELVSVLQTGEFGIGIANPTTKLHIDGGASALIANLDADTSIAKSISFRTNNSARINLEVSGTESGSNAGMDFFIRTYSDAGSLLNTPLTIIRSSGNAIFTGNLLVNISSLSGFGVPKLTIKQSSANDYEGITIVASSNNNTLTLSHTGTLGRIATSYGSTGATSALALATNGVDRITIGTTGNIGVGTTNLSSTVNFGYADTRLEFAQVNTTTNIIESLNSSRSTSTYFSIYGRGVTMYSRQSGTGTYVESLRVTEGGNILLDNAQLNTPKYVSFEGNSNGGSSNTLGDIRWYNYQWDTAIRAQIKGEHDTGLSNGRLTFWTGGGGVTERMRISANGIISMYGDLYVGGQGYKPGGGSWANSSDIRLKENIKTIDNALDKVLQLRGVTFDWKEGYTEFDKKESAGFIADEVMEIFPEWVAETNASETQKEIVNDDKIKSLSLPFHFDALLVEAIKEQQKQIDELKALINK